MAFNGKRPRVGISYYDFWVVPLGTLHALKEFFMYIFFPVGDTWGHLCTIFNPLGQNVGGSSRNRIGVQVNSRRRLLFVTLNLDCKPDLELDK